MFTKDYLKTYYCTYCSYYIHDKDDMLIFTPNDSKYIDLYFHNEKCKSSWKQLSIMLNREYELKKIYGGIFHA